MTDDQRNTEKQSKESEKSIEERMEEILQEIEPDQDDFMNRRINHIPFAKVVVWLNYHARKSDFVYASELSKFMKVTQTRAYTILRDLCKAGLMTRKNATSTLVEFHFSKNGHKPLITKYLEKAMRTLDLADG